MPSRKKPTPYQFKGVMVSGTFDDLQPHRTELMKALQREKLFAIEMGNYVPDPDDDVISSSLNMVREASAYIGLISHRYGKVIESEARNPNSYSVSRLEFEEAQRLDLPTLIFVMGDEHPIKAAEVETDPEKIEKLESYRERAKDGRIYVVFNSLEDFTREAIHKVTNLRRYLEEKSAHSTQLLAAVSATVLAESEANSIPAPPAFYAEPPYIGTHNFLGRTAELDTLSDWASPADPHPILLFEAIGGSGKSMLTWEWTTKHATIIRNNWAGRFWYSFYEKGAIMTDFCQRALAYITRQPLKKFQKKKIAELSELLFYHLQAQPWLLILDGLERVLVAYHRFDAAQIADEQVDTAEDQIASRDPYSAIRPEDDDLLRMLAAAAPSKLLITTRLTPRILLNPANQGIQGVLRVPLPGLRPADAEQLLRAGGITGTSQEIQNYLKSHCDCHPLVTGALAGLINDYLPDRGNFDAWAADSAGGGQLNLAHLDLVQKRNHILLAAFAALPEKSRELLSTLAILSESVDFPTLSALNPHLPPVPEEVEEPENPEENKWWHEAPDGRKEIYRENYQISLRRWKKYDRAVKLRQREFALGTKKLTETVRDLERRGLLQYDRQSKRYDLHPVVRGVAAGRLKQKDKKLYGQRVVDHFSQQSHVPYDEADTFEDVRYGLHVVRTLIQMGHYEQACSAFCGELSNALLFNLEAYGEILSIIRPMFSKGWGILPEDPKAFSTFLATEAAIALTEIGELEESLVCYGANVTHCLEQKQWESLQTDLLNIASLFGEMKGLSTVERLILLAIDISSDWVNKEALFRARLFRFTLLSWLGRFEEAESMWHLLDPMGRNWSRALYRPGDAEANYARFQFFQGVLKEKLLTNAEYLAKAGKNRGVVRLVLKLRGEWRIEQEQWALAAESLHEAVRMAREIGGNDWSAEAMLSLAKLHLGQLSTPSDEAERLAKTKAPPHRWIGEIWFAVGEPEYAKKHALAAYKNAWADGEPYVYRYDLNKSRALLKRLGAEIPNLPPYDPTKDEKFPWEDAVAAGIEELRAEKAEQKRKKSAQKNKKRQNKKS